METTLPSAVTQQKLVRHFEHCLATGLVGTNLRNLLEEKDRNYYRELDKTKEQQMGAAHNRLGDASKVQNVTVPVVAPQVETGLAYLSDVFLSSYPIFPVVSKPDQQDEALEIETVLGESAVHFQWTRHFSMCFRDGLKYNLHAAEVEWVEDKTWSVVNQAQVSVTAGAPVETIFAGNQIKRIDPYNLVFDRRVPPAEVHIRGDFVGYVETMTRIQLKSYLLSLDKTLTMNATNGFESGNSPGRVYSPQIVAGPLQDSGKDTNWASWAGLESGKGIDYSETYEVGTLYARIVPKEFGLGVKNAGIPQIYKMIVINGKVLVYLQRKTNAHNYLPIIIGQLIEDGLALQTKSFADNATPYQQLSSSLYNSALASQRRKVYDRMLYDPSRVKKADIDKVDPVARIPVSTEGYGKPLNEAVFPLPYRDEGVSSVLQIARDVTEMADIAVGQNRVQRGQFQKGNKTRYEFDTVMGNSDSRMHLMALLLESAWLQPIKHILKYNILQYQPPATLYNRDQKREVEINPVDLRKKVWEFQIADGILPVGKLINMELLNGMMQIAMTNPMVMQEWDVIGILAYSMKLQGAKWINDFRRQGVPGGIGTAVGANGVPAQPTVAGTAGAGNSGVGNPLQ